MAQLQLERLSKHFGPTVAVHDVSLDVPDGSLTALLGPSGSGKTTLLNLIVLSFIGKMKIFDLVWITTRGGPLWSTETVSTYVYKRAFENGTPSSRDTACAVAGDSCASSSTAPSELKRKCGWSCVSK